MIRASTTERTILEFVADRPGMSGRQICEELDIKHGTFVSAVYSMNEKLEKLGQVTRIKGSRSKGYRLVVAQ